MGGMAGALVVDVPSTMNMPASYTAMESHLLFLTHVALCSCNPTGDPFRIIDYQELKEKACDDQALDAIVGADSISDVYLTNGQWQVSIPMASPDHHRALQQPTAHICWPLF